MDDDKSFCFSGEGAEEGGERAVEVDCRCGDGGDEVGGKFLGGGGVRWRRLESGYVKVVELDLAAVGSGVGAAELGLAIVGGGAYEVDGDVEGGEEVGEVEELVQMAMRR